MHDSSPTPSLADKPITTAAEAIDFVHSTYQFGSKFGLENMSKLLDKMGNPHLGLQYIHVAGTNGKGSTCAIMTQVLIEAGYTVGTYVSPYLERFNERIQINRLPIIDDHLAIHGEVVRQAVLLMLEEGAPHPTEFEIVTAIGFSYYKALSVDVVVLEVGLGGRLDSTNVIPCPLAAVITPVDYDHMQYLGNTLSEIAAEKAGIIKGGLVICAQQQPQAQEVIAAKAATSRSEIIWSNHTRVSDVSLQSDGTRFAYRSLNFTLRLLGDYQIQNACTAIDTLLALHNKGVFAISEKALVSGVEKARWAGRFEQIHLDPLVIIDGAHNLHGVMAFKRAIHTYHSDSRKIAVFGMLRDKEANEVLGQIANEFESFYTVVPNNPRALAHSELRDILESVNYSGRVKPLECIEGILQVLEDLRGQDVVVYCFGSLYYIGEVRTLLLNNVSASS